MRNSSLIVFLLVAMTMSAQEIVSPDVHADSTVTFRYYNPQAKWVSLQSSCLLRKPDRSWFGGKTRRERMTKGEDGVFTLTTAPLAPEVYQYRYIVDGTKLHDPLNPDSTYILLHQESIVAVGGTPQADLYVENADIPHGRLDTIDYYDKEQQVTRKVVVYLPPCLSEQRLPVLYLLHGISGDERAWVELGRVAQILDNMLAKDLIRPMLVVMPDCNVLKKIAPKHRTNLFRNMMCYPALQAQAFEKAFPRLMQFVEGLYPVSPQMEHHAIAGLSSGAKQAANIVCQNPNRFAHIGLFSPVLGKEQVPTVAPQMYVAVGQNDLFYRNGKRYIRRLKRANIPCVVNETDGSHTWCTWREYLTDFLQTVF